jgi:imidazolonepropionase-like amidohydrolase
MTFHGALRTLCVAVVSVAFGPTIPFAASNQQTVVFTNVTVIDGTGRAPQPGMTVLIREDRIARIGRSSEVPIPAGTQRVDGTGKFLIPGLWDMHVHLTDARPSAIPALVAHGITGVRDMGSLLRELDDWRVKIDEGTLIGPRIVRAGPILNGQAFGPVQLAVADAAEARGAVRALAKAGVDFIKIHKSMSREQFLAIINEAKQVGLPVAGHIPETVTPEEASDSGIASIEHTESLFQNASGYVQMPHDQMLEAMASLFQRFAKNGTFYTPCLIMYKTSADWRDFTPQPQSKYVARSANARMQSVAQQYRNAPDVIAGRKRVLGDFLVLVGLMRKNGVKVLVGTDLSDGRIFPGFSVHPG